MIYSIESITLSRTINTIHLFIQEERFIDMRVVIVCGFYHSLTELTVILT